MAASAHLTLPLALATPAQVYDATEVLSQTPGASDVFVDASTGKATLAFQFPGNIDAVMRKLLKRGIASPAAIAVEIPVANTTGRVVDPSHLAAQLDLSPMISNAAYGGRTVSATIVPRTASMRYMFEEIMLAGLTAVDRPGAARPQDFVL